MNHAAHLKQFDKNRNPKIIFHFIKENLDKIHFLKFFLHLKIKNHMMKTRIRLLVINSRFQRKCTMC